MELGGLHHVTAVTGRAGENVSFYTEVLGMRLVKKTVNQDDVSAYHLFYGDRQGSPGTELTFFDWPALSPSVPGAGTISRTGLRVPGREALEWWAGRLADHGVRHGGVAERGSRAMLQFDDPEGQRLELVDDGAQAGGTPWEQSPVPAHYAIRGLGGVTLTVDRLDGTAWILTEVMGFRQIGDEQAPENPAIRTLVFETGVGGPAGEVRVESRSGAAPGIVGTGGVHHVAFRTEDAETQRAWRERLASYRVSVTPQIERFYFKSIYFREPGGVLFEIATDGPGFATDEDAEHLGERLALPPFLEPRRTAIEAGLRPLPTARSARPI